MRNEEETSKFHLGLKRTIWSKIVLFEQTTGKSLSVPFQSPHNRLGPKFHDVTKNKKSIQRATKRRGDAFTRINPQAIRPSCLYKQAE